MELVPVESSNVAAIGYAPEYQLMRVRFRDGSTYDYPATSAEAHQRIMNAPSKGKALAGARGIKIGPVPETITLREPFVHQTQPLQTFESDECCAARIAKVLPLEGDRWICPKCGTEWRVTIYQLDQGEGVKHWAPYEPLMVIK
jgi:hypothetical protein